MKPEVPYSCMETCGQEKPCGNRYCSAHPQYFRKKTNTGGKRKTTPNKK